MNKGVIYYTKIREEYKGAHMEHMIAEKLLEIGLKKEFGIDLEYEPRAEGEHGKPFLSYRPAIHYNISHSGEYVYVFWQMKKWELMCRYTEKPIMRECWNVW